MHPVQGAAKMHLIPGAFFFYAAATISIEFTNSGRSDLAGSWIMVTMSRKSGQSGLSIFRYRQKSAQKQ